MKRKQQTTQRGPGGDQEIDFNNKEKRKTKENYKNSITFCFISTDNPTV